jgi:outer membrane protein OmpA-like peptidoglycan-associated protein
MKVTAKCMNHSGCLKAFRGEPIELDKGAPLICPECGKPVTVTGGGAQSAIKAVVVLVGIGVLALGGFVASKAFKKGDTPAPSESTDQPVAIATPEPVTPGTDKPEIPGTEPVTPEPAPGPVVQENTPVTPDVRQEVLARIDEIPDLTPDKKDRLYNAVQRAQEMRKIVEIPFASGQSRIQKPATDEVKKIAASPEVTKFRDNLTAIFVVLGFADTKGNKAQNYAISRERANSVKEHLERNCDVKNIIHSVPMGSSSLVDKNNAAKNRVVEIWMVLPKG